MKNPKISIVILYANIANIAEQVVETLKKQTFQDFEAVFVNCNSDEISINSVSKAIAQDNRFSMVTLPYNDDYDFAKNTGLDMVSGEYVCFIDAETEISANFIENIYYKNLKQERTRVKTENNRLYKRNFIENNSDIDNLLSEKIEREMQKLKNILSENEKNQKDELQKYYQNTDSTISNKVYDVSARCNSLEKLIFEKENTFNNKMNETIEEVQNKIKENNNVLRNDFDKIYNHIDSKFSGKDSELNKVYDKIDNSQSQTEQMIQDSNHKTNEELYSIMQKIENLYKEQDIRYNNLKNIIDSFKEETNSKIEAILISSGIEDKDSIKKIADIISLEDKLNKNFDKIYSFMNEHYSGFYAELTKFYKEMDEKLKSNRN